MYHQKVLKEYKLNGTKYISIMYDENSILTNNSFGLQQSQLSKIIPIGNNTLFKYNLVNATNTSNIIDHCLFDVMNLLHQLQLIMDYYQIH